MKFVLIGYELTKSFDTDSKIKLYNTFHNSIGIPYNTKGFA